MWERFGYYLMIGIFQLYLLDPLSTGGLAMDRKDAATSMAPSSPWSSSPPSSGGLLADRVLGYSRAS
jgi:POT family proton-dependent oligopeptide transporter